jgi:shikimate kinase
MSGSPRCVLIGPPGAGKSTIAALVASELGCELLDTDRMVTEAAGKSVSEIFVEDGESVFRSHEALAVASAVNRTDAVVAVGGGAVMNADSAALIAALSCPVIFLDVSISSAAPRIGFNRDRPLLIGNPRAQWISLMEGRRARYETLATAIVKTDEREPSEIVAEVLALLGEGS